MNQVEISQIDPATAKLVCKVITATLPEWFGVPEANQRFLHGMLNRVSFAASIDHEYIGLISLEFPYAHNANIYWMAVNKKFQGNDIGRKLLRAAETYCYENGYTSMSVETLSPKQSFIPHLRTYYFYEKCGFRPLLDRSTYGPENLMVYMHKPIGPEQFKFIDLSHTLHGNVPSWTGSCGFHCTTTSVAGFSVQTLNMDAGIGTHIDVPSHMTGNELSISDYSMANLMTQCYLIDVSAIAHENYFISVDDIQYFEERYEKIRKGSLVIFHTGWSRHWPEPEKYRNNLVFPSLASGVADYLLWRNVAGIAIDTLSPDNGKSDFSVHQKLLSAGKYIIENISNAELLDPVGNYVMIFPLKIAMGTESPVRVIGLKQKCYLGKS